MNETRTMKGRLEIRQTVDGDATLMRLTGPIDEAFSGFDPIRTSQVVLELGGLTRITSYGVRQWIKARDQLSQAAKHLYYVNCPPCFVDQLNMVLNFGGPGQVVSAFAPFTCTNCRLEHRVMVDIVHRYDELLTGKLQASPCPSCKGAMEMDELPETFFGFVRAAGARAIGGAAAAILAASQLYSGAPLASELPGGADRVSVQKLVHEQVTYFRIGGVIDKRFRARSLLEGVEGEVVLDLRELAGIAEDGREEWDRLRAGLAERARLVTLVDVPPPILSAMQAGLSLAGAVVYSIYAPHQCQSCNRTADASIVLSKPGGFAAKQTCKACGGVNRYTGKPEHAALAQRLPGEPILAATREVIERREDLLSRARIEADATPQTIAKKGTILGKYEIVRALSVGGMAEVFLAVQRGIGGFEKPVALKRIRRTVLERRHFAVEHFLDEAKIAATLAHPNIAQIFDVGEEDGVLYLAMEYVHGKDLRVIAKKRKEHNTKMPLPAALFVVHEVARALHHAYTTINLAGRQLKAIHRDVSPHNILCGFDGAIKLVDFGVAISATTAAEPTHIAGKQSYMSPEQLAGQTLDARSDLFSLGVVLYELLTDQRPFAGEGRPDMATVTTYVPVSKLRPELPPGIDAIVDKLLANAPSARFSDGNKVAEAIATFAKTAGIALSNDWMRSTMPTLFPRGSDDGGVDADGVLQHTMQTPRSDSFSLQPGANIARLDKLPPPPVDDDQPTATVAPRPLPAATPLSTPALVVPRDKTPPPTFDAPRTPAPVLAPPPALDPRATAGAGGSRAMLVVALLLAIAALGYVWAIF